MITVLMATWQGKKYLEQQLDSILAQTVPVRILISDDGSDDGTREMLDQYREWYPKQIRLVHHKQVLEDAGTDAESSNAEASNTEALSAGTPDTDAEGTKSSVRSGIKSGTKSRISPAAENFFWLMSQAVLDEKNEYILLSDQDDVWFNDKVKTMIRKMKEVEKQLGKDCPVLLHSDMEVVDENLNLIDESFFAYQHCNPARNTLAEVLVENPATGGAMMMNRALLELVKDQPKYCCMHDWWIALTAVSFGVTGCCPDSLYQYRQHGDNTLGAKMTGSMEDMKERLENQEQVEENYQNMMRQAAVFLHHFGPQLAEEQRSVLRAFLALPLQTPAGRMKNILRNHFFKSSKLQTMAMCVTIPRKE